MLPLKKKLKLPLILVGSGLYTQQGTRLSNPLSLFHLHVTTIGAEVCRKHDNVRLARLEEFES